MVYALYRIRKTDGTDVTLSEISRVFCIPFEEMGKGAALVGIPGGAGRKAEACVSLPIALKDKLGCNGPKDGEAWHKPKEGWEILGPFDNPRLRDAAPEAEQERKEGFLGRLRNRVARKNPGAGRE